ncbi:uncharacterized protein [Asterias amurensis]|uniref:uncharacterized protein isoform X3 n=1 Tax=Asterias amurensis TaxID=7602 RepID=UPI003AB74993
MPIQAPQWTEFLSCPVCFNDFDENVRRPISLGCGHTVCKMCLRQLHQKQCPFDQTEIGRDIEELPANYALLQLVGAEIGGHQQEQLPNSIISGYLRNYAAAKSCVEELAWYLQPLGKAGLSNSGTTSSFTASCVLSKPMQRKLVALVNCQLVEEEGRSRAMRAARSLGERTVTELILQHQNQQQLSANLWAAVRARGCQFLGPAMQEETLKLVLLALEDGAALSRKVLVMFVVQKLEQQFPQASKTSVGHVVQLLYRASCFKVTKRDEESSLMQLKDEFRNYDALRREHDAQIVQIAMEAGLRISPEQWSSLLYGDLNHKSHMQSIIDKLQTPASFAASIQELTIALQRSGDPGNLGKLRCQLDRLGEIDPNSDAGAPSWSELEKAMIAVKVVVQGLVNFVQNHSLNKKALEQQQTQNIKYKTSMCRDISQKAGCPRGSSCTFAHSEEEVERYRAKSRRMLSALNRQVSSQNKTSERANVDKLFSRGVDDGLTSEDHHELMELKQHIALRDQSVDDHQTEINHPTDESLRNESLSCRKILNIPGQSANPASTDPRGNINSSGTPSPVLLENEEDYVESSGYGRPLTATCNATISNVSSYQYGNPCDAVDNMLLQASNHRGNTERFAPHRMKSSIFKTHEPDFGQRSCDDNTLCLDETDGRLPFSRDSIQPTVGSAWDIGDISLGELCERKQEILYKLSGFSSGKSKNPWERNESLPKTVASLWTIPNDSITKQKSEAAQDDANSYNPWTSQAPFSLIRPVKEINTNYTMTYSKATVRHMSVIDHLDCNIKGRPMGTHELSEFKKMSMQDLENTLQKVKQEDKQAGSCHYERGQKIQLEMDRRVKQQHTAWNHIPKDSRNEMKTTETQLDFSPYTSDAEHCEMTRYYQTLPIGAFYDSNLFQQGHNPMSKSSRTPFKSTGPVQVSAGPSPETNPVTLTQECLVAPSFQSSPSEGYHFHGQHYTEQHTTVATVSPPTGILKAKGSDQFTKFDRCSPFRF